MGIDGSRHHDAVLARDVEQPIGQGGLAELHVLADQGGMQQPQLPLFPHREGCVNFPPQSYKLPPRRLPFHPNL